MRRIHLAAAALNQTPLAWNRNRANILAAIEDARTRGAGVLCLPELCISGYGCEDAFFARGVVEMSHEILLELLEHTGSLVVTVGVPVRYRGGLYNAAALLCDGRLLGLACKQNLAGDGIHYEPRWFRRWSPGAADEVEIAGQVVPLGDLLFDLNGIRIGFEICEDAWVADRPGGNLAARGADIILNPSASHFAFGKQEIRRRFVVEGSRAFCVAYAYANLVGNEAGRAIYDGGTLIATRGAMVAEGPRFSYRDMLLTDAIVDIDANRSLRGQSPVDPDESLPPRGRTIKQRYEIPLVESGGGSTSSVMADWESGTSLKEEEFSRAVPLALFDYLRKSRSRGCVVSLSGGADSSSVATMVHLLAAFAFEELGADGVREKLSYLDLPELDAPPLLVGKLLTCVYQATRNSSETTRHAAEQVARAIGAEYLEFDVDAIVGEYTRVVAQALKHDLDWETDDVPLQNIQARARGPSVWLLANLRNALLLTTSNRSEAAVGYATMDGDTCGGLAPIAGIDKAFLRHWLKWMEQHGPHGVGPLPALQAVNDQQPTAELRPPTAGQTDESDLMPYELLDAIERAAIRDKLMPIEVFEVIRPEFGCYSIDQLAAWIEKFFRLWCQNQWKRERYAPSFHLDDENLDPKTWCRFPILSGGYERELAALQEHVTAL